jgi:glucuronate isomerase
MSFIHDDFLLQSETARRLYHEVAADLPIIDYHCHLPPEDVAADRQFKNLFEIWLEGDHYKWRAMRTNGVAERYCTGEADPWEKFLAYAETVPHTLRNPLYHWSHLELKRYFGIDVLLNGDTAREIWDEANRQLATPQRSARGILEDFKVEVVCTTDDPADSLEHHQTIAASDLSTKVYPTFRPDAATWVHDPENFNAYADKLGTAAGTDTSTFAGFTEALRNRHDFFHRLGGRLSDHGLETALADFCTEAEAAVIFDKARGGDTPTALECRQFTTFLMVMFGKLDAGKNWTKQLHLGPMRNNNTHALNTIGRDAGFDSIGDYRQGVPLSRYLDALATEGSLPRTILYNINPSDNYLFATMIGNFQDGTIPGKIQFGSGWWFLDQLEGMTMQMNALSNLGLLSRFVGMLTDSRSFLSYPRHEYFRRLLCNLLGEDVRNGIIPNDFDLLAPMVRGICHDNAKGYFGFGGEID